MPSASLNTTALVSAKPSSCLLVIFGASGDLTKRKLIPSLYELYLARQLPEKFAVLGVSRSGMTDEDYRQHLRPWAEKQVQRFDLGSWQDFVSCIHYHAADSTKSADFASLGQHIEALSQQHQTGANRLFYLSMAPQLYDATIENIGASHLVTEGKAWCSIDRDHRPWQRIIVEKPFGHDVESAAHLNRVLGRVFEEESIYRIDHYLGKETVQNLLVFRFANTIFEPIWNRNYIDHIQITAAETVGVEGRGGYYDSPSGGAMRDMIQSHLLQLMAVVAMEPPVSIRSDDIRAEKVKVLKAVAQWPADQAAVFAVRGQYASGVMNGQSVPGYLQEPGVAADSSADTYAAMQVNIDTWRWSGVPFYLRSGKRLARKETTIVVYFKPTPHCLFRDRVASCSLPPNQIVINVQPDEGIRLCFEGKVPGITTGPMNIKSVVMDFDYQKQFRAQPPEAYSALLLDAMRGDQTLFKHRDEIEQAWRIVQPVLDGWRSSPAADALPTYPAGTWGPVQADRLLESAGRHWHRV